MKTLKNWINAVQYSVVMWIGSIRWKPKNLITPSVQQVIADKLRDNYYIMLTHRKSHLSTYITCIGTFFCTGKLGYWAHAMMNLEDQVNGVEDFRIVEALGEGVTYTPFEQAVDVNGIVLLKPKHLTIEDWTAILDKAKSDIGKPYDTLFDLTSDQALSCVEFVRNALKAEPNYDKHFAHFEKMIQESHNQLPPQLFYDCDDFEVVFEVRQ